MLSGRTSHTRVESFSFFGPKLDRSGGYGDLAHVMLCNTLVLWGWSVSNPGVSSGGTSNSTILPQSYQTGHGHDLAGIALRPTSFLCPSRRWGRGEPGELATGKSEEFWRRSQGNWRPRFLIFLTCRVGSIKQHQHACSNQIFLTLGSIKQSNTHTSPRIPMWPWALPCWNCTGSYKFSASVKKMGEG